MKNLAILSIVICVIVLVLPAPAQRRRRDPLTPIETDQLREVAPEPDKKVKLYVDFARARMVAIEQLRKGSSPATDRGQRIHDLLEDFTSIIDELDDNLSDFAARRADERKALKGVIDADGEFQAKLRALKEWSESDASAKQEAHAYSFVLTDATEAVDGNLEDARAILEKQNAAVKAAQDKAAQERQKYEQEKKTR
jgi:hypothetical protein